MMRVKRYDDLLEELIREILLRLPARTLVSLRSVCTSWRNLISAPDFTWNHLRRSCLRDPSLTPLQIAYYCRFPSVGMRVLSVQSMMENPSEPTRLDCFRGPSYYSMVGSFHGLLCMFDDDGSFKISHAMLWNPCTGFTFKSPEISGVADVRGFGYDHLSDTYKLYGIFKKEGPSGMESSTRIYTFGPTSSWRRIDDIPLVVLGVPTDDLCTFGNTTGVFFGSKKACTINWSIQHVVLYFDLGKETYGHFTLPVRESGYCTHLSVLRDCLSLCYEDTTTRRWIMWQMKEYGDPQSWTTLAMIPFHPRLRFMRHPLRPLRPLYISETDVLLALSSNFQMILYNLNDGSVDFPVIDSSNDNHHSLTNSYHYTPSFHIYHESLVSPHGLQSNSSQVLLRIMKPKPKPIIS
ncbi:F-box/kelch-repeat protein At3g23880-like [Arachis duranensis]|uniref:F-box/kelch-repeat protein At3g23880-like n=1 Tax=Arachis duranensis TaxID=130453 RepID=A0A9C6TD80_ARADU|nr:F-box/kelch-repeat protein At3g23880-like [Arachis duranensis]